MKYNTTKKYTALLAVATLTVGLSSQSEAALVLAGGGLALLEEGPVAANAGDAAPTNLATGKTAFAHGELSGFGHFASNVTNGTYGNVSAWIGDGLLGVDGAFIGIDLGASMNLGQIAFSRSNVLAGDHPGGAYTDRVLGLYTLQFTQLGTVDNTVVTTDDATTGWADIGFLGYDVAGGTNYANPHQRHLYSFDAVDATGIRLIVPGSGIDAGTAIDEIELYAPVVPEPSSAALLGLFGLALIMRRRR